MSHRASTFQAPLPGSNGEEGQLYGLKLRREDRRLAFVTPRDFNAGPETRDDFYDLQPPSLSEYGGHGEALRLHVYVSSEERC